MKYSKRHLALCFSGGLLLGLLLPWLGLHGHMSTTKRMDRLARKLALSADQKEKIGVIFENGRARLDKIRQETRAEIRPLLDEAQKSKFDEIMAEHDKRRKR